MKADASQPTDHHPLRSWSGLALGAALIALGWLALALRVPQLAASLTDRAYFPYVAASGFAALLLLWALTRSRPPSTAPAPRWLEALLLLGFALSFAVLPLGAAALAFWLFGSPLTVPAIQAAFSALLAAAVWSLWLKVVINLRLLFLHPAATG